MKRVALIVNPFASEVNEARTEAVASTLGRTTEVSIRRTSAAGHATQLAREAAGEFDAIVVYAGDGGSNEAVNGAIPGIPFGFVPGGGTNVLARSLGLPREPVAAARRVADALANERTRTISLGRVNGRRFSFSAGIGLDAELVRRVDALGRRHDGRRPGDLAYAWTAVKVLAERRARFEPSLEVVGRGRAAFALVSNTDAYTYAGPLAIHVAPHARFELGIDLVAPIEVRARTLPRILRYAFLGRGQERAPDVLYAHDLDALEVVCDAPMPLQADGEDLGDVTHAAFAAERGALEVLV